MADDTTTATATTTVTAPAPVVSTNIEQALPPLFLAFETALGVSSATLKASLDQHEADQAQIKQDQANLTADEKQIADDAAGKTAEDAALTSAEANQVSLATIAAIDNVTNALNAGQPIPAGGIPTGPIPPITGTPSADGTVAAPPVALAVGSTVALPTDPADPNSPTVDHTVTAITADGTISATPAATT